MQIIGIVSRILIKSTKQLKKRVVIINDTIDPQNVWCIEFRKELAEVAGIIQEGDNVKVKFRNEGRIDDHQNYYNNIIAEKIERL